MTQMKSLKIHLASDLHLEFLAQQYPGHRIIEHTDADILVLAGDIHNRCQAIGVFKDWPVPVIYIHGNHEFYEEDADQMVGRLRAVAAGTNVHFLENDEYIFGGVRFLGCCLWTDYALHGEGEEEVSAAMCEAAKSMRDHEVIRVAGGMFMPHHARALHEASRAWLERKLDEHFSGPTVVVTHHGPHPGSIHRRYQGDPVNPAFHSDLTALMGRAKYWFHGHTHSSCRYSVTGPNGISTTVIANPCGYPEFRHFRDPTNISFENREFDRRMVVEVPLP